MKNEDEDLGTGALDRLLSKFGEPWFIALCFVTTWAMIFVVDHMVEVKISVMQDFINDKLVRPVVLPVYDPSKTNFMPYNYSVN